MAIQSGNGATVIGVASSVSGQVTGDADVVIKGRLSGKLDIEKDLSVENSAVVRADVSAVNVVIAGVLVGNVVATETLQLTSKARVVGNLNAPRIMMEPGAAYRGKVDMGEVDQQGLLASRKEAAVVDAPVKAKAKPKAAAPAPAPKPAARIRSTAAASPKKTTRVAGGARPAASGTRRGSGSAPGWAKKKARTRK